MISEIPVDRFKHCFLGHNINDCSVRSRGFFYFTTREDYSSWPEEKWDRDNDPPPDDVDLVQHIIIFNRDSADPAKRWSRASLRGWKLLSATGLSRDGSVVVGFGVNPSGKREAWVARLGKATSTESPAESVASPAISVALRISGTH